MNSRIYTAIALISLLLLSACKRNEPVDEDFLAGNDIELRVGSTLVHRFNPLTWQLSFNKERREYRVFDDVMSKYYSLTLNEIPVEKDQKVRGTVSWTTARSTATKRDLDFTVVKTDSQGTVWLWNGKEKIGISVFTP